MGASGSKAAARTYQAAEAAAAKRQRSAQQLRPRAARSPAMAAAARSAQLRTARAPLTLEEEEAAEAKDASLDQLLARLGGSIRGTRVDVAPPQAARRRAPALEPWPEGRLPADALRELFQLQAQAGGGRFDLSPSVAKYKTDPGLARSALARACLPQLIEAQGASGVAAFARWPQWFRRRGG